MAKAKRVAPELMNQVREFQQHFELELIEIKCQSAESQKRADKFMEKTRADRL